MISPYVWHFETNNACKDFVSNGLERAHLIPLFLFSGVRRSKLFHPRHDFLGEVLCHCWTTPLAPMADSFPLLQVHHGNMATSICSHDSYSGITGSYSNRKFRSLCLQGDMAKESTGSGNRIQCFLMRHIVCDPPVYHGVGLRQNRLWFVGRYQPASYGQYG